MLCSLRLRVFHNLGEEKTLTLQSRLTLNGVKAITSFCNSTAFRLQQSCGRRNGYPDMCSFTIQFVLETRRCLSDKLSIVQSNLDFSVFKTESTVYKCHLLPWKYGGACFVCVCFVLYFFDVILFFGCLCLCVCVCVFFLPCAKYEIRLAIRL